MVDHVLDAIEWKRAHPADDLLTALIDAEHDGDRLSPDELLDQVVLLFIAGHETTVNLIGNGTLCAAAQPRAARALARRSVDRRERGRRAAALRLRRCSSHAASPRPTSRSAGHTIAEGTFVLMCLAAANRDPAHWGATRRRST